MSFDILSKEVSDGILGKNSGIPMGFNRLNKYMGIRKKLMFLLIGSPGSGKSALLHHSFILSPYEWYVKNKPKNIKLKIILFSMERSKVYTLAKWMSRRIFLDEGVYIPIGKLLGWWDVKLTKDEHDLFLSYKDYFDEMMEVVDIIEGAQNPTGVYKYVKDYALKHGRIEEVDEYHKIYVPNNADEIVLIGEDHLGLTKLEKGLSSKKEAIDKLSEYNQYFRDFFSYVPIPVMQLGRNLNNPIYLKMDSFEPTLEDAKESGNPGEAADCVLSLFDPRRLRTQDSQYNVDKFIDPANGANYFRSLKILKNTYGEDLIKAGLGFMGSTGIFSELPSPKNIENFDYNSLFNHSYFLQNN
jgi:hypothetical protein